jgi:hypothetical protein
MFYFYFGVLHSVACIRSRSLIRDGSSNNLDLCFIFTLRIVFQRKGMFSEKQID